MLTIGKEAKSKSIEDGFLKFSWEILLQIEARQAYSRLVNFEKILTNIYNNKNSHAFSILFL